MLITSLATTHVRGFVDLEQNDLLVYIYLIQVNLNRFLFDNDRHTMGVGLFSAPSSLGRETSNPSVLEKGLCTAWNPSTYVLICNACK